MDNKEEYNESLINAKLNQVAKKLGISGKKERGTDRLPPGQHIAEQFPVLDLGVRPPLELEDISIKVHGHVLEPFTIDYKALMDLPSVEITKDFHCVTRWSKYDLTWKGVPFKKIVEIAKPVESARYIVFGSRDNYTTNLSLEDATKQDVLVAYELNGEGIPLIHGGPVRALVPHLYGWKSAKFLNEIKFVSRNEPGFWEQRGYHDRGDPWLEQRYS